MGFLHGMLGNASEVNSKEVEEKLVDVLVENEEVVLAYKVIRDEFIFTDKRLILIDKQGLTGKKVEYHSIPYKSISHFSVETNGHFDMDSELKIWVSHSKEPIEKEFKKGTNLVAIQKALSTYAL